MKFPAQTIDLPLRAHKCPGPDCDVLVPDKIIMCRLCWRRVPMDLRRALHPESAGSDEYAAALKAAVDSLRTGPKRR